VFALCLEASHARGYGHLYRVLRLATELRQRGVRVILVSNQDANALQLLEQAAFPVISVPDLRSADDWESPLVSRHAIRVWVNDRLSTDEAHAQRLLATGARLATIDDQGTGAALADLHVAPLAALERKEPPGRRVLSGMDFLILDPVIARLRRLRVRADRWIVTLGGTDTYGVSVKVVRLLRDFIDRATVVVGPGFQHLAQLREVLPASYELKQGVPSLVEEFSRHDVAVTGGGITAFEACASGLPTVVIANEPHEHSAGKYLERLGCARFAGEHSELGAAPFKSALDVERMSKAGMAALPSNGASRVAEALLALA
jgi:spore coat polysaccharide biosynthesis predicted glycosyltransferase SpsG